MPSTSSPAADPAAAAGLPPHHAAELERLDRIARRMDTAFRIPVLGIRFGWDGILGLLPGVGDAAALAPAAYIIWRAHRMGAAPRVLAWMTATVAADAAVGTVPLLGDIFDIGLKANRRNVALLRDHLAARAGQTPPPTA